MSPFKAMLGWEARLPVDLILLTPAKSCDTVNAYVEYMVRHFNEVYPYIRKNQQTIYKRYAFSTYVQDK